MTLSLFIVIYVYSFCQHKKESDRAPGLWLRLCSHWLFWVVSVREHLICSVMYHHLHEKRFHIAVLLHRGFLGVVFLIYALPVLLGGPDAWVLHSSASIFQHAGTRSFYGFLELCLFTFGGIFFVVGIYIVPVSILLTSISALNMIFEWTSGAPFFSDVALFIVFLISCLVISIHGAGRHSLDYRIHLKRVRQHRVR